MRLILSFLFFNILTVVCLGQNGNNAPADTTRQTLADNQRPKVPKSFFIPTGIRIGTDLVGYGVYWVGDKRERYEFQADIDFHRLYLVGSFGLNSFTESTDDYSYTNDGNYYRIGIDADFLKFDPDHNTLTFGLRYAQANYAETLSTFLSSPTYGNYEENFSNENVSAWWIEMVASLRVMIFQNLYTGYTFRIQLNRNISGATNFRTYDIPGFGKAQFNNRWTFNYYLTYRIPWKEKQVMEKTR